MSKRLTQVCLLALFYFTNSVLAEELKSSLKTEATEIVSGQQVSFHSQIMNEKRTLLIKLPEDYDANSKKKYPVIYTLDGQTHFRHLSGTIDWLSESASRTPQMIVVAIANTQRGRDMTASYNGGGGDKFANFIKEEVIPYVDSQYRTQPFRILSGHSMAGHFTLNVLNLSPDLFDAYIAMSPWFHQDRGETKLAQMIAPKLSQANYNNKFVYTSIGDEARLQPKYDRFINTMEQKAPKSLSWHSMVSDSDNHMSIVTATMNNALQFIYAPMYLAPDSETAQQGVEAIKNYYQQLSEQTYGYFVSPESAINQLGHYVMREQQMDKAIDVFKANIKEFPESSDAYASLAVGYYNNKQYKLALENIDRAINLGESTGSGNVRWHKRRKDRIVTAIEKQQG